jgi:hypothetical protein
MEYPWFQIVRGADLEQGDILESCPVFLPRADEPSAEPDTIFFDEELRDVIVTSQSCDLVAGREKITEVLLCPVWHRAQLVAPHYLASSKGLEEARRGILPGFHVLAASGVLGFEREVRIVDFRRVYSLPVPFVRRQAEGSGERLRLLPPYREHLSQAFARFFMRVGLPVNIPPFR